MYSFFSAILFECVKCIYTVHPKSDLLEKAAKCIGNFVLSPKINLKYLGKLCRKSVICSKCLPIFFASIVQNVFVGSYSRLESSDLRGSAGSQTGPAASDDHHRVSGSPRPHRQAGGET